MEIAEDTCDDKNTTKSFDGTDSSELDEYVEITNLGTRTIWQVNWPLRDAANPVCTVPSFQIQPKQTYRVYTNENYPEWCGFNYGSGSAIWNYGGDTVTLRDGNGTVIDMYPYP